MNRIGFSVFFCLVFLSLFGCQKNFKLDKAYHKIYLAKYAIDFPLSRDKLENCKTRHVKDCVNLYETAKQGKDMLLAVDPNTAINYTLKTIEQHCLLKDKNDKELCSGAIMSLYYFNTEKLDQTIFDSFRNISPELKKHIFGKSQFAWFSNRPNSSIWIKYIEKMPEDYFIKVDKDAVIAYFKNPVSKYQSLGITLL